MGIFLGDKPVDVYFNGAAAGLPVQGVFLGPVQVFPAGSAATVPDAPVILYVNEAEGIVFEPPSDGGSAILGYNIYVNDGLEASNQQPVSAGVLALPGGTGIDDEIEISAENAVGEGPRSNMVTVT
jgi:hypothetical protein